MRLTLRVGDVHSDLTHITRVTIERLDNRSFVTGLKSSGQVIALFAVKPRMNPQSVPEAIQAALGSGRPVCCLTDECVPIEDDAEAKRILDEHKVARPFTLAESK